MADEKNPLDLSLEDLLIDEESVQAAPEIIEEIPPAAFFDRHSRNEQKETARPVSEKLEKPITVEPVSETQAKPPPAPAEVAPEQIAEPQVKKQAPAPRLSENLDREAVASYLEQELIDEFNRIMPELMDQALDHMVEILPIIINEKLTTRMLDYLLENRIRILEESQGKLK